VKDVKDNYTLFHKQRWSNHLYPTEWVIRTMLGSYPELYLDKTNYVGGKILDLGFGDGRNMLLLKNCGLKVYGVEITEENIELGKNSIGKLQVDAELKVGSNTKIPYEDNYFDYILASSSCYYVDEGSTFDDNMKEIKRVLKTNGSLVANFPAFVKKDVPVSFILEDSVILEEGHVMIKNDIYGIRNGYRFKTFDSREAIANYFQRDFEKVSIGLCLDNYYGVQINQFIVTAKKK
jgi:SAM-dependent methyltransferase